MSLFGSTPPASSPTPQRSRSQQKSLFDDDRTAGATSTSSLFADDNASGDASPWNFPTPKKAARAELIKTLLPASDVPESYINAFDVILNSGERLGVGISVKSARKVLEGSGLKASEQARIFDIVVPGDSESEGIGRNAFNVLLALIGLSQEDEEATLDGVDERRRKLPRPSISYIRKLKASKEPDTSDTKAVPAGLDDEPTNSTPQSTSRKSPTKSRQIRSDSFENPMSDPWASPAMHRGHAHTGNNTANGASSSHNENGIPPSVTGTIKSHSEAEPGPPANDAPGENASTGGGGEGWESFGNAGSGFPNTGQPALDSSGFGAGEDEPGNSNINAPGRSLGGSRTHRGVEENVVITLLPEKEGVFMFQHRNYEVKSTRRATTVIRRYSDFVWLLDCLHKRYPFRQLPLLPPKTLAVNGRHLSSDATFIEKRRRGLARFTNALVRHPVLSQEQLVVMFLTVPTELAVWRKQATISVQEEFIGKALPPGLEDSLPTNLNDTFDTVRSGVRRSSEAYISLCTLLERLTKRNQGLATDYQRFSLALKTITEESDNTYATDTNDVLLLNEGIKSTAKHMETSQSLIEDEARAWDEGVLEDFKRQRDTLVGVRDMFDRRDRYAKDNIPQLERRIEANERKLAGLRQRPEGTIKPEELRKVEDAITNDKQSIVNQHARGVFIQECIRDELIYFQQSQYHVTKIHQDWSQERVKYSELQADNWRALSEEVDNMPLGD